MGKKIKGKQETAPITSFSDLENLKSGLGKQEKENLGEEHMKKEEALAVSSMKEEIDRLSEERELVNIEHAIETKALGNEDENTALKEKKTDKKDKKKKKNPDEKKEEGFIKHNWNLLMSGEERTKDTKSFGTNLLRATGFGLSGYAGYRGIKRCYGKIKSLFSSEKKSEETKKEEGKKEDKKMSWWKKTLLWAGGIGAAAGTAILGYKNRNWIKGKFFDLVGENLSIEDAVGKVQTDISNLIKPDQRKDIEISYDKENSCINSCGASTKIDIKNKKVEGLDVTFPNYEEMIHAASIINISKIAFIGKCNNANPFYVDGGNIKISTASDGEQVVSEGTGIRWGTILGGGVGAAVSIAAGYFGGVKAGVATSLLAVPAGALAGHLLVDDKTMLAKFCPTLNKKNNKQRMVNTLNAIPGLEKGVQQERVPDEDSPLQPYVNKVINKIEATQIDGKRNNQGSARRLKVDQDLQNPEKYELSSWGEKMNIRYKNDTIEIEGIDLVFTDIEEGIRLANFINRMKSENKKLSENKAPFVYRTNWDGDCPGHPGIYFRKDGDIMFLGRIFWHIIGTRYLTKDAIKKNYPSLLEGDNMNILIKNLNAMKDEKGNLLWRV